jgi:DNA transformation protein
MAKAPSDFVAYICDQLEPLGPIRWRRMFGGYGIYCDELFFAIVAGDVLHFKTDAGNRQRYEAADMPPFQPFPDKPTTMNYHQVPDEIVDDPTQLCAWANEALAVALRARR